ncbi:TCR gamma alternate reading frame protein isoform X1 [Myotis myotis]|uniref:TCR gamma alternate reading frame protein isoform X1 n=1 Tax=Myotis myotis TaxID=51298 RepID=UPI0017498C8C|nr:TCR gamma alternate reading frame protein isoform X1 [Myotis myotis]
MATLWIFLVSVAWVYGDTKMRISQDQLSFIRRPNRTVHISCKLSGVPLENAIVHWYQQKNGEPLRRILYGSTKNSKDNKLNPRLEAYRKGGTFNLIINNVVKSDEAIYYCACWDSSGWIKIFAEGTQLVVIPSDRSYGPGYYPKPTIFQPSAAEISLHKAGTHICLLEKFFPDVIKVYWKEKNGNTVLESQQGNTMKTDDTYMKFSWLTVSEESMNKEHKCIVKHEHNKVDQEILFPAIKKEAATNHIREVYLEDKSDMLQLQLINTSAYYTYLLLLLKSLAYFAVISFCLVRRTAACGHGKSS